MEEYKAAMQTALSKEQYKELKEGVEELSDLLFVRLREVCTNLEKALPQDVDRLRGEHDVFYNQKIPELEELRMYCNLKSAFESGYAVFVSHPEIKAEKEKLSEEVHRQCTMDHMEECKDEVTTQYASQVCVPYNFEEKFMQAEGLGVEPTRRCSDC